MQVDDEPPLELVANNVICANGRAFGGGIKVCPQAEPDDGLLDVLVWGDVGKLDLALNLPRLYRGTHLGHPKVTVLRARRVRVEPTAPAAARARRRAARHDACDVRDRARRAAAARAVTDESPGHRRTGQTPYPATP